MHESASYEDWQRAYGDVYEALPQRRARTCPNCGLAALRLEFVAREDRVGYAMFWCDFCLLGIHVSQTLVPVGVDFHPLDTPWAELSGVVPEYRVVHPPDDDPDDDPDDVEDVTL